MPLDFVWVDENVSSELIFLKVYDFKIFSYKISKKGTFVELIFSSDSNLF